MKSTSIPLINEQLRQLNLWITKFGEANPAQAVKVVERIDTLRSEIIRRQLM